MISHHGDGVGGTGLQLIPESGNFQNVIVWFHGLGDKPDNWASILTVFGIIDTKFVFPCAPNCAYSGVN